MVEGCEETGGAVAVGCVGLAVVVALALLSFAFLAVAGVSGAVVGVRSAVNGGEGPVCCCKSTGGSGCVCDEC